MCGLIGFLAASGTNEGTISQVEAGLPCMRHRGPDEHGTWHDKDLILGFNRLSIIDIEHSHQPLHWGPPEQPNRYALSFNGEIYNYLEIRAELKEKYGAVFHTEGDSESIVAAFHYWGLDAIPKLRGMFAFAVWDTIERKIVIARDPFGIKPLFLATGPGGTAFGSEKKSLLELLPALGLGTDLDPRAIQHYTELQYVPEPETLHKDIGRLESGCYATFAPGEKPVVTRYFKPQFKVRPFAKGTEQQRYHEIAEALRDSVAKHMRADVTVGSFLSGGIDSTAIAALAIQHNPKLITFTVGFDREGYSEVDVAAETADAIGARHVVKKVTPEEYAASLPSIVWYLDDPVADPSLVPLYFVAREARKHVKVVLSGEGSDELFGGYTIYREPLSLRPFEKLTPGMRRAAARLSERMPEGRRGKSLLSRGSMTLEDRYYGNARSFNDEQLKSVLRDFRPEWLHQDVTAPIYAESKGWDPVARMQHLDLFTWMRGDILVKADKITMANSLELRVPFLDNEVYRVAEQIPYKQKITNRRTARKSGMPATTKYALRRALEEIVPPHVLHRPKLGFPVPLRHWLAGPELYDWAADHITASQTDHIFNKAAVMQMLVDHRAGVTDNSRRIWNVLVAMIWHGIFVEKRIVPQIEEQEYALRL